jgi:hypothetical protein
MSRTPRGRGEGIRPHDDLGEPEELPTERDVAHLLLELRAALDEVPSSSAAERARDLVRELLAREQLGTEDR